MIRIVNSNTLTYTSLSNDRCVAINSLVLSASSVRPMSVIVSRASTAVR